MSAAGTRARCPCHPLVEQATSTAAEGACATFLRFNLDASPATTRDLTKLAFALAAYRADHGSYPARLAELAPKYVREVPKDIFNDAELHYRREDKGYCLYSVGRNGKDDGGKGVVNGIGDDESMKKDWDDMVIRVPAAQKQ